MRKILFGLIGLLFAVPAVAVTLPAGYTELEYIESTGTQYIDTGIMLDSTDKIEVVAMATDAEQNKSTYFFGAYDSANGFGLNFYNPSMAYYPVWKNVAAVATSTLFVLNTLYTFEMSSAGVYANGTQIATVSGTFTGTKNAYLFWANATLAKSLIGRIYSAKIWKAGTLTRDLVPAKNASGVIGMYDTVSGQFFTNAGTGEFIAGPVALDSCRNLFDKNTITIEDGYYTAEGEFRSSTTTRHTVEYIKVLPNTTYTISGHLNNQTESKGVVYCYDNDKNFVYRFSSTGAIGNYTFTTPANCSYVRFQVYNNYYDKDTIQLEKGSTATEYVPYCANPIKIATTAYNSARFSPVVTELNDTIATIRDVVTNTINQTKAIADLQATKQTRPDENCPAGKKCLLVEDDAGQPHWYEIIENAYGLPNGYTALEYIESTGTQYIDTGAVYKSSRIYNVDFQYVVYPDGAKGSLGARQTSDAGMGTFDIGCNQIKFYFYNNSTNYATAPRDLARHTVEIDYTNSVFKFDGETLPWTAGTGAWQGTYNIYIGRENIAGSPNTSVDKVKWYSYKVYDNGVLIQNLIPAKNSSGVIGMYDLANPNPATAFYRNSGTGTFVAGPEI